MVSVSVCMIVRDEEEVLARCLSCVTPFADEIIVVDTGSRDRTKEIARGFTEQVYEFPWCEDFSAARNYSFSMAKSVYCMWLDADDVIAEAEQRRLLALKERLDEKVYMVMMRYAMGAEADAFSYYRERWIKNTGKPVWKGRVHEAVTPRGTVLYEPITIVHQKLRARDSERNLRIYENMRRDGVKFEPRDMYYYARELYEHGKFEESEQAFRSYLSMPGGWCRDQTEACRWLAYCLYRRGEEKEALRALLKSMEYAPPGGEVCCDLGKHFLDRGKLSDAVFWFRLAASQEPHEEDGGFCRKDCYGYLPSIYLAVCYDRLGDLERAYFYNEKAGLYRPEDAAYLKNKAYFEKRFQSVEAQAKKR